MRCVWTSRESATCGTARLKIAQPHRTVFLLLGVFLLTATVQGATETLSPLSQAFIDHINSLNTTWKAGRNFAPDVDVTCLRRLLGVHPDANLAENRLPLKEESENEAVIGDLPVEFDARSKWPNCPSIGEIHDQGDCSSGWAVSTANVMSDRECIHSNGTSQFRYSADDLLSCCETCGNCTAGMPNRAWIYWISNGIVSGGDYGSHEGCRPYELKPKEYNSGPSCAKHADPPECVKKCIPEYSTPYDKDLHYGKSAYWVTGEKEIMKEIMTNGPVDALMDVFEDFYSYKTGVYQYVTGQFVEHHLVRMLGWGVQDGTPYWLMANSWNATWGDKGFYRIKRGNDECGIESSITAGIPKLGR